MAEKSEAKLYWGNVKTRLKILGLTQEKLAIEAEIIPGTLKGWITRNRLPDVMAGDRIAKVLGVSSAELTETFYSDQQKNPLQLKLNNSRALQRFITKMLPLREREIEQVCLALDGILNALHISSPEEKNRDQAAG